MVEREQDRGKGAMPPEQSVSQGFTGTVNLQLTDLIISQSDSGHIPT